MATSIVGGTTQQHYYKINSDLDLITISPTKEAIYQYLSQVKFSDFPEFVIDILTKVEGHTVIDMTDGPGDEKQDILTINPSGKRCLTQCKHKERIDGKYSGDELDRIVSACLRKNCIQAIFVTNGDLSPQAKNYVTDKEYLRGWPNPDNLLDVDYWNGYKIWEKIKNNQDILNKWFSGMGQAHGLRNFKFNISLIQMPFKNDAKGEGLDLIIESLIKRNLITVTAKEDEYLANLSNGINLKIKKWFQFASDWHLKLNIPIKNEDFWNHPLFSLSVEVEVPENITQYIPTEVKENIVKHFFNEMPSLKSDEEWWHITISQGKAFIFLHDISEPRQIELDSARTFINSNSKLLPELIYCGLEGSNFKIKANDYSEKSIWIDENEIEIIHLFEQSLNPAETYQYQQIQLNQLDVMRQYEFRAVKNITNSEMMRIRKILDHDWVTLTHNDKNLLWGFPSDTDISKIQFIEKKLEVLGLKVSMVNEETKEEILSNIQTDIPPITLITTTEIDDLSVPVNILRRGFWLNKDLKLNKELDHEGAIKLLEYKFTFENKFGFDNMNGETQIKSHTSELPNLLFDLFTIRCNVMLDISIVNNPITINLRYFENSTKSSVDIATEKTICFTETYDEIKDLLKNYL
jgi:hypothetical protein